MHYIFNNIYIFYVQVYKSTIIFINDPFSNCMKNRAKKPTEIALQYIYNFSAPTLFKKRNNSKKNKFFSIVNGLRCV